MITKIEALEKSKLILSINQKAEEKFGELKFSNFSEYLDKISQMHVDAGLAASVIIVRGIPSKKRKLIEGILKSKSFKVNTQIRAFFDTGEELAAQYTRKK